VWAICYSPKQAKHIFATNLSNTLLIRKGVDLGRKAVTKKEIGRRVGNVLLF
jgi:hypothetical protein